MKLKDKKSKTNLHNKMNVNRRKYKKKRITKAKSYSGGTNMNQNPVNAIPHQVPEHIVITKLKQAKDISLHEFQNLMHYFKSISINPKHAISGLFYDENACKTIFKWLGAGTLCEKPRTDCRPRIFGGGKPKKSQSIKKMKKYRKKFRRITYKKIKHGGENILNTLLERIKNKRNQESDFPKNMSLSSLTGGSDKNMKDITHPESLYNIKKRLFDFCSCLSFVDLYLLYFTIINIKNAAFYHGYFQSDETILSKIESYTKDSQSQDGIQTVFKNFYNNFKNNYEKETLHYGLLWFYINFHALDDIASPNHVLLENGVFSSIMDTTPKSQSDFDNKFPRMDENEITSLLISIYKNLGINLPMKENIKSSTRNKNKEVKPSLGLGELLQDANQKDSVGQLLLRETQNVTNTSNAIKDYYDESNEIYQRKDVFTYSLESFDVSMLKSNFKDYLEYNSIYEDSNCHTIEDLRKFDEFKKQFKKGIATHYHEFVPNKHGITKEDIDLFEASIESSKVDAFSKTFEFDGKSYLYSLLYFIEFTHLCHIIETCIYKKIYCNTLNVNQTLAPGQKIDDLFRKIKLLQKYDSDNLVDLREEECQPNEIEDKYINIKKDISKILKQKPKQERLNNYKFFEFVTNPFVDDIEKRNQLKVLLERPNEHTENKE